MSKAAALFWCVVLCTLLRTEVNGRAINRRSIFDDIAQGITTGAEKIKGVAVDGYWAARNGIDDAIEEVGHIRDAAVDKLVAAKEGIEGAYKSTAEHLHNTFKDTKISVQKVKSGLGIEASAIIKEHHKIKAALGLNTKSHAPSGNIVYEHKPTGNEINIGGELGMSTYVNAGVKLNTDNHIYAASAKLSNVGSSWVPGAELYIEEKTGKPRLSTQDFAAMGY